MDKLIEYGIRLGLEGGELRAFITEQQRIQREEREIERQEKQNEIERQEKEMRMELEEKQRQRDHELEMAKLIQSTHGATANDNNSNHDVKMNCPKLPTFVDRKDDLDSYLNRFERFAKSNGWNKAT